MAIMCAEQLAQAGFKSVGKNVRISDKASFYNAANISIGDNSRIDDFCVLSAGVGGIEIGRNVHLAVYSSVIGAGAITLSDFCNISSRVSIYSSSDDYSGMTMTNPTVPPEFTGVSHADVSIGRHVIIGSGSVVLPGVRCGEGAAIGALSLVRDICQPFGIYAGVPAKLIRERRQDLLKLEQQYLSGIGQ
jgi:acetyltransferase-like isoleucine patch superfamily enzyme